MATSDITVDEVVYIEYDMKWIYTQKYRVVGSNPTYIFKQFRLFKETLGTFYISEVGVLKARDT